MYKLKSFSDMLHFTLDSHWIIRSVKLLAVLAQLVSIVTVKISFFSLFFGEENSSGETDHHPQTTRISFLFAVLFSFFFFFFFFFGGGGFSMDLKKGKIGQTMFCIIHVILLESLQYLLSQILQTKLPVILDIIVVRHANLRTLIVSILVIVHAVL